MIYGTNSIRILRKTLFVPGICVAWFELRSSLRYLSVVITNLPCDVVVAFMFLNQQSDLAQLANQVFPGAGWCLEPHACTGLSQGYRPHNDSLPFEVRCCLQLFQWISGNIEVIVLRIFLVHENDSRRGLCHHAMLLLREGSYLLSAISEACCWWNISVYYCLSTGMAYE